MQGENDCTHFSGEISHFYENKTINSLYTDIKIEEDLENINDLSCIKDNCNVKQEILNIRSGTVIQQSNDSHENKGMIQQEIELFKTEVRNGYALVGMSMKSDCEIKDEYIESEIVVQQNIERVDNKEIKECMKLMEESEDSKHIDDNTLNIQADYVEVAYGQTTCISETSHIHNTAVENEALDTVEDETVEYNLEMNCEDIDDNDNDDEDIELCIIKDDISAPDEEMPATTDLLSNGEISLQNCCGNLSIPQSTKKRSVSLSDEDEDTIEHGPKKRKKYYLMLTSFASLDSLRKYLCERKITTVATIREESSQATVTSTTDSPNITLNKPCTSLQPSTSSSSTNRERKNQMVSASSITTSVPVDSSDISVSHLAALPSCSILPLASRDSLNIKTLQQILSSLNTSSSISRDIDSETVSDPQNSRTLANSILEPLVFQPNLIPSSENSGSYQDPPVPKSCSKTSTPANILSNTLFVSYPSHTTTSADVSNEDLCYSHDSQVLHSSLTKDSDNNFKSTLPSSGTDLTNVCGISCDSLLGDTVNKDLHKCTSSQSLLTSVNDSLNKDPHNSSGLQTLSTFEINSLKKGLTETTELPPNKYILNSSQSLPASLSDYAKENSYNSASEFQILPLNNFLNEKRQEDSQTDTVVTDSVNKISEPTSQLLTTASTDTLDEEHPLLQSLPASLTVPLNNSPQNQHSLPHIINNTLPTLRVVLNRLTDKECESASLSQRKISDTQAPSSDSLHISIISLDKPQKPAPVSRFCHSSASHTMSKSVSVISTASSRTLSHSNNIQNKHSTCSSPKTLKKKVNSTNAASGAQPGTKSVSKENKWNILLEWMKDLSGNLKNLDEKMDLVVSQLSCSLEINNEDEIILDLPTSNYNDFVDLENKMKGDSKSRKKLLKTLMNIGGRDMRVHISNMLRRLMTDHLANQFSLSGKPNNFHAGKKCFLRTWACRLIYESCRTVYKDAATDKVIYSAIGDWLCQAKTRLTRREKRREEHSVPEKLVTSEENSLLDKSVTSEENVLSDESVRKKRNSTQNKFVTSGSNSLPDKLVTSEDDSTLDRSATKH